MKEIFKNIIQNTITPISTIDLFFDNSLYNKSIEKRLSNKKIENKYLEFFKGSDYIYDKIKVI